MSKDTAAVLFLVFIVGVILVTVVAPILLAILMPVAFIIGLVLVIKLLAHWLDTADKDDDTQPE